MDPQKILEYFQGTLDPNLRAEAEAKLDEIFKIIGFSPILLNISMDQSIDISLRQAAAIYLKNMVVSSWEQREPENPGDPVPFSIHENDKQVIRDHLIAGVVHAPAVIREMLIVVVSNVLKVDFPGKWPEFSLKMIELVQSGEYNSCLAGYLCLYQLIKHYEYKRPEERASLNQIMMGVLPLMEQRFGQLHPDPSQESVSVQKILLKNFFALIQYFFPLDLITKEAFGNWVQVVKAVTERPVPPEVSQASQDDDDDDDDDSRESSIWWKCKKWAMHIAVRVFERYGSPGNVETDYNEFANHYLRSYSGPLLESCFKVLDNYRNKIYVSQRVLQLTLNYVNLSIGHVSTWKYLKPHIEALIRDIIFPVMNLSDSDLDLFENDPVEYLREKFDIFEEFVSPVTAAQSLLHSLVSKRKEMLEKVMTFCMSAFAANQIEPRQKDGILHMIGAVAPVLLKRKNFKHQMEALLVNCVYPMFTSEYGFLRARACWVLHQFSSTRFADIASLSRALEILQQRLIEDTCLPVKVEAALAMQSLVEENGEKGMELLRPQIRPVIIEMLKLVRETENDELSVAIQKLVCAFEDDIAPIAVEVTQHLVETFEKITDSDVSDDDKAVTAMGLLNTIESVVSVMEENKHIMIQLENIVLRVITFIIDKSVMDFYEEALSLVGTLTVSQVSPTMWQFLFHMYHMFERDGFDYFTDMMPALHNYITVDTEAFLSDRKYCEVMFQMCSRILNSGTAGEDPELHAAKLLEVIILQSKDRINEVLPSIVELALQRLTRSINTSELRTMCLQVVIAAIFTSPLLLIPQLAQTTLPNATQPLLDQFLSQWLNDLDCIFGIHDRKVSALGLCTIISTIPESRPEVIARMSPQLVPAMVTILKGLKRAYIKRAENDADSSGSEGDEEECDENVLESDEDEVDEEGQLYLESLKAKAMHSLKNGDDDDEEEEDSEFEVEETALEGYYTPLDDEDCEIDEFVTFARLIHHLQTTDANFYQALFGHLDEEQRRQVEDMVKYAEQRQAAAESRKLEKSGGYMFNTTAIPTSFNFGGKMGD